MKIIQAKNYVLGILLSIIGSYRRVIQLFCIFKRQPTLTVSAERNTSYLYQYMPTLRRGGTAIVNTS